MFSSDGLSGFEPRTADPRSSGLGFSGLRLLSSPAPLDCYELRAVIAESTAAVVYLGTDRTLRVPVAIREYMPQGLASRDALSRGVPLSSAQQMPFARGRQAFIDEARTLARCDHPCLLRIVRLLEANGTAYSVMPHYVGRRLTDVRRDAMAPYDEQQLRALLADLLGALEAFHAFGSVHGGVSPDNILLLQNGRPVLLRPRAQSRATSADAMGTLTGYMNVDSEPVPASVGSAIPPWTDLRGAARDPLPHGRAMGREPFPSLEPERIVARGSRRPCAHRAAGAVQQVARGGARRRRVAVLRAPPPKHRRVPGVAERGTPVEARRPGPASA